VDTLFHGVLGAALCSRTGLAGGRRGPVDAQGRRKFTDWTFWAAFLFGVFPDLASLGIHFSIGMLNGNGIRWQGIPDFVFVLYNITHSLFGMAVILGLLVAWKRPLLLPALAWPLHVLTDVPTHGSGVFTTPLFWPFSNFRFSGWNWWTHPEIFYGGWMFVGLLLLTVVLLRVTWRPRPAGAGHP
jgi:hypothetical protein